ncbi:MAG: PAS domain S-box protein [Methanomicrobiales archaeon]|nr:PAS domain S-box protein [Methanomicrobiales archaeon]
MAGLLRVLYVDDEPGLLGIGKRFLEKEGAFTVDTLTSAKQALEQLNTKQYDVIISDYQMPEMDGIQFLVEVRARFGQVPFILFTGRGRDEVVIQAINSGADFYIQKGGDPKAQFAELTHKVRQAASQKRAEEAIKRSEAQLIAIIQGSPIPKFVIDRDHHVIHWNKALEGYSGILEKEIVGTNQHWRAFYKEARPCLADLLLDGAVEKIPDWYVGKYATSKLIDGAYEATDFFPQMGKAGTWLFFTASAITDDKGEILGAIETLEDITETRLKTEELTAAYQKIQVAFDQAKLSEDRYRNVVEDQTELISRFYPDGTHVFVNEAYCRYFGKSREDIIGHIFMPVIPKEDRLKLKEHFLSLSPQTPVAMIEHRITMQDGSVCWQRWSERAIFDNEGKILEYQSVGRDITDIKNAEIELNRSHEDLSAAYEQIAAVEGELRSNYNELANNQDLLRQSENRYRNIVEDQTEFISRFLPDGTHVFVNEAYCRCFGKTPDEIIGHIFVPDIPKKDQLIVRQHFQSLTPENPVATVAHRILMPDGSVHWHRWSDRAIFNEAGSIVEYQSVGRDITEQKEVEEAIKRNEAQLTAIIQSSPIPKFVIDKNHCVIHWNKALEGFSGIREKDIVGTKQHWRAFYEEARPCMADLLVDGTIGKISRWYEGQYSTSKFIEGSYEATDFFPQWGKNGTWLYFLAAPIRDTEGNIIGAVETIEDITGRKMAEEALRESERRVTDIISFLPDATLVIDKNGTLLAWNHAMEEMTGVPAEQMIGKANYEYALPFYHERRPITVDLVLHDDPAVVAKYPVIKRKGKSLYSEIFIPHLNEGRGAHLWFTASPLYDTAGNLTGAIESIRDITERKQAEEALRTSEERYHDVIEDQTEFICRFLPDGTHIFVNEAYCRYFDKKQEEIIGHRFRPVIPSEDREIVARHMASLTPQHPVTNIDHRIIMPDGSTRWQRWSDHAIFDQNGGVIQYQSVGRDITDTKELEKEMEFHEQELMKSSTSLAIANRKLTLLSSISRHDINNQLTILQGYLEILEDSQLDPSQSEYFGKVSTAAKRISAMIQFTKEYEEIGVLVPAWQDCRTLVDTAAKQNQIGVVIVQNDLPAGADVFADPLVVRVFYNLMDNAVRYGGKITTIRFSALESGDDHMIVCEDDGDGIIAAEKEKIFERGFGKNTGMGLFLSREILSITGITIAETGEPGQGTRFEMTVPKGMWRTAGKGA